MPRFRLTTYLDAPPDVVWDRLQSTTLLNYIAKPLLTFQSLDGGLPTVWREGQYRTKMRLFGFLPLGEHVVGLELPAPIGAKRILRDKGESTLANEMDHWIFVEPDGQGTRYTDRVDFDAGWLTPFAFPFVKLFFAHRQRRWKKLVASNFSQLQRNVNT